MYDPRNYSSCVVILVQHLIRKSGVIFFFNCEATRGPYYLTLQFWTIFAQFLIAGDVEIVECLRRERKVGEVWCEAFIGEQLASN